MSDRVLSDAFHRRARELMTRYPTPRSALLLALHDAQDEVGHISEDVMREIGRLFDLDSADVAGVVSFYTMYKRRPVGRYLVSLCTNVGCALFGADDTAEKLAEIVGPQHEPTDDGLISWEEVECLAYCGAAPAAQVNYRDVPNLTADRAERLCEALRAGSDLDEVLRTMRADAKLPEVSSDA